jgi:enediyne biosynthesis protein E4
LNSVYLGWGCGFIDIDNDSWPDILYVNGHVYPEIDQLGRPIGYRQPKVLYRNTGAGKFIDASKTSGSGISSLAAARGCAFGDYDNDGDVDVLINPINEAPQLLRCNAGQGNHWIKVKLIGTKSNRSAIGARVRCVTGARRQIDEVRSGGSFYSQNDLRLHFGLGKAERVDLLEIRWSSGLVDTLKDVAADQILKIKEGGAVER